MKTAMLKGINAYLSSQAWPAVRFQPILYFFLFGAAFRLAFDQSAPPNFDMIAHNFYVVWLMLGITGPMLALLAWWLIRNHSGSRRFQGMWLRLSADIQVGTVLITYHIQNVADYTASEDKIFGRYMTAAAMLFVIFLVIRDMWTLVLTERLAGKIHRNETL